MSSSDLPAINVSYLVAGSSSWVTLLNF
jgi:hypothetical protein